MGDEFLGQLPPERNCVIKVDVEGVELRVFRGFRRLLLRHNVAVLTEVTPDWLHAAGDSERALFDFFADLGYSPYLVTLRRRAVRHTAALVPLARPEERGQYSAVFMRRHSAAEDRLAPFIAPR